MIIKNYNVKQIAIEKGKEIIYITYFLFDVSQNEYFSIQIENYENYEK